MLATVAATGVTRSKLTCGHKPQGQIPSLSDPLGVLVFAALRPYAHASGAACASLNQVNVSPCSGLSSFEAARAQACAGDAKIGPAAGPDLQVWRADSCMIDQLSETQPEDDSEQLITRLTIRIIPRRKAGQLVKTSAMELSHKNVATLFHLPLHKAASKLGISPTTLKRACRKVGIFKWPFRLLENEKMEEAAARMLRLLNPRPNIPATDPTSDCSRNSTPYSSPASNVSTDMCISDHRPYRIPNQADITQAVRLLTEENVENRRHLLREQEENRRLLRM